ncbi:MAG: hypothetical protein ACTSSH_12635 [Candidatus Heimdallarchaeota archaeon]
MKFSKKSMIGLALVMIVFIPAFASMVDAQSDEIGYKASQDGITISTKYMTMKIVEDKPHFIWWNGNQSTADEMYNVQFPKIQEYFGDDDILDTKMELIGGISYNLLNDDWTTEIVEDETSLTVTMTLTGLANGAELQFIVNVYSEEQPIAGTDQVVEALSEIKFDIVIDNWIFTEGAAGLTIETLALESQQRNRVRIRNGTQQENGNATRTMFFESEEQHNNKVAYFEWATFADVSNAPDPITVGSTIFQDGSEGEGIGIPGMVQIYLTYPNYGDNVLLVHDPSIGIFPDSFSVPLVLLPIIGGLTLTAAIFVILKKRK